MKKSLIQSTCLASAVFLSFYAHPAHSVLGEDPPAKTADVEADGPVATHQEPKPLDIEFKSISALCLTPEMNLLAGDAGAKEIKVISPDGKVTATWKMEFAPEAIEVGPKGTIYVGGSGRLAKLDAKGKVLKTVKVPTNTKTEGATRRGRPRPVRVSGIGVAGKDLYVAFGSGWSMGSKSKLFRFDTELENPILLAENLRGCCQRCDIIADESGVYIAENSAHRVVRYDRDGKILDKWGERNRTELSGFGSCCNPMNLCFDGDAIYTSESGLGRIKKYTKEGKYLGLVGYVGVERFTRASGLAASCSNIAIAVVPGGKKIYVMDFKHNQIRVLQEK